MNDFVSGYHGRMLWIDNGSSFLKIGLLGSDLDDSQSLIVLKRESSICARHCIVSADDFLSYASDIARHIESEVKEKNVDRICFTGIREGVVLCSEDGKVVCALTNKLLGSQDETREAHSIIESARGFTFMSIQGYVFRCLTGCAHMTMSEAKAISYFFADDLHVDPHLAQVKPVPGIAAGELVECTAINGVSAALCGTDEQASVLGAKLITGSDCQLSTGTFWSLSLVNIATDSFDDKFGVRIVDGDGVLPPFSAVIGYRWGELFWSLLHGHGPATLDAVPPWAGGRLVEEAMRGGVRQLEHAIELASDDITNWIKSLATFRRHRFPLVIAVRRTDSPIFRKVVEPVMARLPCEPIYMDQDPTAVGASFATHLYAKS